MSRLLSLVFSMALVLLFVPLVGAQPYYSPVVDFEGDTGSPELHQEMFLIPESSVSTAAFIVANTPGTYDSNAAYRSTQWPITGDSSLWVEFDWVNPADPAAWMRLSTFNADVWPNPSIHLGGKVRFSLVNEGDWSNGEVGICLGIRETGEPVPQLEDGGTLGDIEWVGVSGTAGTGDDIRPIPTFTVPVHGFHVLIEFDLSTGNIWVGTNASGYVLQNMGGGFGAMTGDGVLDGTRGTLEHIAITNVSADTLATMSLYIDDLRVESPDPDPVYPPTVVGPITMGDGTITVADLLSTADQVTLYRGTPPVFVEMQTFTPPMTSVDFTISPLAATGECFVATQRESISGDTSEYSDSVCALPGPAAYTFNVCLDEDGSNCSPAGPWEMVPAESRGTSPIGEIAPHGQIIYPNNAIWQTIDIPLDIPALVTYWLGGDGTIAPAGTGLFSFDSFWFTSLGGPDALGNHEVFIDAIEALDENDDLIASIYSMEDGVNYMSNSRSQSSSSFSTSELSTLASFDGQASHHFEWSYGTETVDETVASYNAIGWACGTSPTFPDTTKTVRVRLLARAEYTGSVPQPTVSTPIVGNQTGVRVTNDATAIAVQLYIDGAPEGDSVLPSGTETDFTGLSLSPGQSVSVRQTIGVETSDYAYPVAVAEKPFPPTLTGPLFPLDTEVTVTGIVNAPYATATLVEVFVNGSPAGSEVPAGDTVVVTVPTLNNNDVVEARQTVNSAVSEFSDPIIVLLPAPVIYYVPAEGDTIVKLTGIDPTATQVTVTVDTTPFSVTYDPNIHPFEVTVAALTAGQVVVAKYTVGADDSLDSASETVCVSTPTDVFRDDFESYADQAEFDLAWTAAGTQMLFSEDRNTTPSGSKSAHAPDRNYRSTAGVITGVAGTDLEPAVFSINILDPTGGTGINQYADLNNLESDWFLAEIGICNLAGAQTHYQARLTGNGGPGWIHLDAFDGPERLAGWHNFTMVFKGPPEGETTGHEVDVYVDGLLAAKNITLNDDTVLREPRMGAGLSSSDAPEGYFDDYILYTGPASFPNLPPVPPSLVSPILPLSIEVSITGIANAPGATASLVEVYVNDAPAASIDPAGSDAIVMTVPELQNGDEVKVRQTVNALPSVFSDPVIVQWPAPVIYYVPAAGETIVKVTGIDPTAASVTVTVAGTPFSMPYDPEIAPFEVTVSPLTAGQEVVAKYTVGADDSLDSASENVCVSTLTPVFCDDFEGYASQAEFDAVWTATGEQLLLSEDRNTTTGGLKSMYAPDRSYRSTAPLATGVIGTDAEPAVFSINILDPTGDIGTTQYASLNNAADYFMAEIGMTVASGAQSHYQVRLNGNGGPGWFHLDQFDGPERSAGWHNFTMVFKGPPAGESTGHEVDLYVDGLLAAKNIRLVDDTALLEPCMGAGISGSSGTAAYFDDYCLQTGGPLSFPILPPPPPTLLSPLEDGDETVRVTNISDVATLVEVFANGGSIGSIDPEGATTVYVPVTALVQFDTIAATQLTTAESVPSSSLEVGNGNGDIFLSIGVRETGDTGDLGTPGTTDGEIEWIGTTAVVDGAPQGMPVSPGDAWQTIEFSPLQVQPFTGDGAITETRGVLEHLAVAVDALSASRSTGAYQIYIDNVINKGAGDGGADFLITDFEGFPLDSETLFQEPGNSGSTTQHNVFPPDYSLTSNLGNPGQSQRLGWFWVDTQAQRWQRISTLAVPYVESPIIDLTKPIQLDILILERGMLKGDLNCDGVVNGKDIQAFVLRLTNPAAYAAQYPDCPDFNGDTDWNGTVEIEDVDSFVALLAG